MEIFFFISCFVLPYLLFIKKIRTIIKTVFTGNLFLSFTGVVIFSCYPLIFDILRFNLSSIEIFTRVIYILIPFFLLVFKEKNVSQTGFKRIIDLFVFIIIWLPIEFNILPGGKLRYTENVILQTTLLGMIPVIFYLYIVVSPIAEKYFIFTSHVSRKDLTIIVIAFFAIITIVLPFGLLIDFLLIKTELDFFLFFFLYFFSFFVLVAIPEEFFFRAILINIIRQDKEYNRFLLLFFSSILFGCAHILSATPRWVAPNWAYFFFSAIAGWFYTWTYLKTNKFTAPVLLHALIDGAWVFFAA